MKTPNRIQNPESRIQKLICLCSLGFLLFNSPVHAQGHQRNLLPPTPAMIVTASELVDLQVAALPSTPAPATTPGATQPILDAISGIPTVPLDQAKVIVDIGTFSDPNALWNNLRADYVLHTNWFLGAELRNNITTIGYIGAQGGYLVTFNHTTQFAPTFFAGYSVAEKCPEIGAFPLYLRYTPRGSTISAFAGAGYLFYFQGNNGGPESARSGPAATAGVDFPF